MPAAPADGADAKKKTLVASEQERPDVVAAGARFRKTIRRWRPERLVFIDETGVNVALARAEGRAPRGQRLVDHVPTCRWESYTLIAGLRCEGPVGKVVAVEGGRAVAQEVRIERAGPDQRLPTSRPRGHEVPAAHRSHRQRLPAVRACGFRHS